jgi:dCTP diphosphatase
MQRNLEDLQKRIKKFNSERDWDRFHTPKDLIIALVSEVGELAELYRWLSLEEQNLVHAEPAAKLKIEDEIADIMIYLLTLSYKANIDIYKAVEGKLEKNKAKYPVEKSRGIHSNPLKGCKGKNT